MNSDSPLQATRRFLSAHLEMRDLDKALGCLGDDIVWFGTGEFEVVRGKADARRLLSEEIASFSGKYTIEYQDMSENLLTEDSGTVFGRLRVTEDKLGSVIACRLTTACVKRGGVYFIVSLHMSMPFDHQNGREYYPLTFAEHNLQQLKEQFFDTTLPGGLLCCEANDDLTVRSINGFFVRMLGYDSQDDYLQAVDGRFLTCIVQDETTSDMLRTIQSLQPGEEAISTYRVYTKTGEKIWLRDCSQKVVDDHGVPLVICFCTDISDIIAMEKAIKAQKDVLEFTHTELQTIIDNLPGGVHRCRLFDKLGVDYLSPGLEAMSGYSQAEIHTLFQDDYAKLMIEEDRPSFVAAMTELSKNPGYRMLEYRLQRKDGRIIRVSDSFRSVRLQDGRLWGFGVATDITEQSASFARLKLLTDSMPGGLAVFDYTENGIETLNFTDGVCNMVGYTREEYAQIAAERPNDLIYAEDLPIVRQHLRALVADEAPVNYTYRAHTKDGGYRWLNFRGALAERRNGACRINGVMFDVTDTMESAEKLRIRDEEYRLAIRHSGKIVYRYNDAERSAYLPPEMSALFGLPDVVRDVPEGFARTECIAQESTKDYLGFYQAILRGDKSGQALIARKRKDGTSRWYDTRFTAIYGKDGQPVSAVISLDDVTQQREASRISELDRRQMLVALQSVYPMVISVNLTQNRYRVLSGVAYTAQPDEWTGDCDAFVVEAAKYLEPSQAPTFLQRFSCRGVLESFAAGQETLRMEYRQMGTDKKWHWAEIVAFHVDNPYDDDVLDIALFRHIDEQKATEEKLRVALADTSDALLRERHYQNMQDTAIPVGTIIFRTEQGPLLHVGGTLLSAMGYSREEFAAFHANGMRGFVYEPDYACTIKRICEMLMSLPQHYEQEFRVVAKNGEILWILERGTLVKDTDNAPAYISVYIDITRRKQMEEELRINEALFQIVAEHSDRFILKYDMATRTAYAQPNVVSRFGVDRTLTDMPQSFVAAGRVAVESEEVFIDFFNKLIRGEPSASVIVRMGKADEPWLGWYRFDGSVVFDDQARPVYAVVSFVVITDQYEKELAYERQKKRMNMIPEDTMLYFEVDLTRMALERSEGFLLTNLPERLQQQPEALLKFGIERFVHPDDRGRLRHMLTRERLLTNYAAGKAEDEWSFRFLRADRYVWVKLTIEMITDPYSSNVRLYLMLYDIDQEKRAEIEMLERAETDGLTGLYNKLTIEQMIRTVLKGNPDEVCALVIVDVDNLKQINDTLGHGQGDRAIRSFAETLKRHFRKGDIIGRIGGDEFLAFLRTAGSEAELKSTMHSLVHRLNAQCVGEKNERTLHGSVGIVVARASDTSFETLYKQADTALYHVKRNGKGSFAFYSPNMEKEDYQFEGDGDLAINHPEAFNQTELRRLLSVLSSYFPLVISANLTKNSYYIMQYEHYSTKCSVEEGAFDELVQNAMASYRTIDQASFQKAFFRQNLLAAYARGETMVSHEGRQLGDDGVYRWVRSDVLFTTHNRGDDVCLITVARPVELERADELTRLRLQKVLALAVQSAFEYLCIVHKENGACERYESSRRDENAQAPMEQFPSMCAETCALLATPEEREAFAEASALPNIIRHLDEGAEDYRYRYRLPDGVREAYYSYYEPSHAEILLAVRVLPE